MSNLKLGICLIFAFGCNSSTPLVQIQCGAGTVLNSKSTTCTPRLGNGVVLSKEGAIIARFTEADLNAYRAKGMAEGKASVKVVRCGKGTKLNENAAVCLPVKSIRPKSPRRRKPTVRKQKLPDSDEGRKGYMTTW